MGQARAQCWLRELLAFSEPGKKKQVIGCVAMMPACVFWKGSTALPP